MVLDYALFHLKFTIPPAIALTWLFRPIGTSTDAYRVAFLILIAVVSTCPWDSYLIRQRIWTYPEDVIIGPKLFRIPAEEVFFFFIQTYCTSLLYLLLSRPIFHPAYLPRSLPNGNPQERTTFGTERWLKRAIGSVIAAALSLAIYQIALGEKGTYMGLIIAWTAPFVLLLWLVSGAFMVRLPTSSIALPIIVPTLYLWVVDTLALRRGTWVIEKGTKLEMHLWPGLDIEEAVFFLLTNVLVVLGQVAFDHALAVVEACPEFFPLVPSVPSPSLLVRALLVNYAADQKIRTRIEAFQEAQTRLGRKSRSFFLASSFFRGRLRQDLILLYSFCRVADDLIDDAPTVEAASGNVDKLRKYLELAFSMLQTSGDKRDEAQGRLTDLVHRAFPPGARLALLQLPCDRLPKTPLYELLDGFDSDVTFALQAARTAADDGPRTWPISTAHDLETYASRVAATVAELSIALVFHHATDGEGGRRDSDTSPCTVDVLRAGRKMGVALQYVNIARDIIVDAHIERVYIPTTWLQEMGLTPEQVIAFADGRGNSESTTAIDNLRLRLLDEADRNYYESKDSIAELPRQGRAPIRVAVESYMEIGRTLRDNSSRQTSYRLKSDGRATVPKLRRLSVAWRALSEG